MLVAYPGEKVHSCFATIIYGIDVLEYVLPEA